MKKKNNKGFMLAETLIVTTFVAGVLIFLFIQFSKLNNSYNEYYTYNTTESLYALEDVKEYIESDSNAKEYILNSISKLGYIDITDCSSFTDREYCLKLLELENVKQIFIAPNTVSISNLNVDNPSLLKFISKINNDVDSTYRLIAEFNDKSYATVRLSNDKFPYVNSILNWAIPNLFNGLLTPVIYDGTNWKVADTSSKWYDYENQWWANAVILKDGVSKTPGTVISVDGFDSDVLAMYVWIPRYEYKISDAIAASAQEIHINFIPSTQTSPSSSEYAINSGFTFGNTNLSGIWVGKFETSHTTSPTQSLNCNSENCTTADGLRILPDVQSLTSNNVSNFFFASRSMGRNGNPFGINSTIADSHMMKNSEWGIAAYLSQSKYGKYGNSNYTGENKEVYINNSSGIYTGRSGGNPGGSTPKNETYTDQTSTTQYNKYGFYTYDDYLLDYNTNKKGSKVANKGTGASTTGNIYGIYDMSGGTYEYVMGVFANSDGALWSGDSSHNSGFTGKLGTSGEDYIGVSFPNLKYYDVYKASNGTTINQDKACDGKICYGHAINPEVKNWYGDYSVFVSTSVPWFLRGGYCDNGTDAGVMSRHYRDGGARSYYSFRLVLSEV